MEPVPAPQRVPSMSSIDNIVCTMAPNRVPLNARRAPCPEATHKQPPATLLTGGASGEPGPHPSAPPHPQSRWASLLRLEELRAHAVRKVLAVTEPASCRDTVSSPQLKLLTTEPHCRLTRWVLRATPGAPASVPRGGRPWAVGMWGLWPGKAAGCHRPTGPAGPGSSSFYSRRGMRRGVRELGS